MGGGRASCRGVGENEKRRRRWGGKQAGARDKGVDLWGSSSKAEEIHQETQTSPKRIFQGTPVAEEATSPAAQSTALHPARKVPCERAASLSSRLFSLDEQREIASQNCNSFPCTVPSSSARPSTATIGASSRTTAIGNYEPAKRSLRKLDSRLKREFARYIVGHRAPQRSCQ